MGTVATSDAGEAYVLYGGAFGGSNNPLSTTGTGSAEMLIGGLGDDTLSGGGGADSIRGGGGNDALSIGDLAFRSVDGGGGTGHAGSGRLGPDTRPLEPDAGREGQRHRAHRPHGHRQQPADARPVGGVERGPAPIKTAPMCCGSTATPATRCRSSTRLEQCRQRGRRAGQLYPLCSGDAEVRWRRACGCHSRSRSTSTLPS
jgi:hypothetical protein